MYCMIIFKFWTKETFQKSVGACLQKHIKTLILRYHGEDHFCIIDFHKKEQLDKTIYMRSKIIKIQNQKFVNDDYFNTIVKYEVFEKHCFKAWPNS